MDAEIILNQFVQIAELTPKNPSLFIFIGRHDGRFVCNVKHLYLYFARHRLDTQSYFFTVHRDEYRMLRQAGLPVLLFPEIEAIETLAAAGTVIVDNFDFKFHPYGILAKGAKIIQLWHGIGFKKIGFIEDASVVSSKFNKLDLKGLYSGYDAVLSTSPFYTEEVFRPSFRAKEFPILGYPRNDVLFNRPTKDTLLGCDATTFSKVAILRKQRRIVLFTPTFRDNTGNPLGGGTLDFGRLDHFLGESNMHMVIKAHPLTPVISAQGFSHITFYDNNKDIYPMLFMVDTMITDYSSIYMDYLLLDRPVIFYCPDYDEYVTNNREFQFPYDEMTPGPKCKTQDELHLALQVGGGNDGYADARRSLRDKAFLHQDGNAAGRIADYLCHSAISGRKTTPVLSA